jgi:hypothetical protein
VRLSISIKSDTIGANGSISVSSAFNATAPAGLSSAVSGCCLQPTERAFVLSKLRLMF